MEGTVQVDDVQAAHAVPPKTWLIFRDGVAGTIGIKAVADASFHMKVEETQMPCSTTQMEVTTLDSGKSMILTGDNAMEEMLHVTFKATSIVP